MAYVGAMLLGVWIALGFQYAIGTGPRQMMARAVELGCATYVPSFISDEDHIRWRDE